MSSWTDRLRALVERLRQIRRESADPESAHAEADIALLEFIDDAIRRRYA